MSTTSQLSNYVSCLGNNDAVIVGTNYDLDVSFNTANTAVSLLSAQIVISKVFPMTAVATGNGFTISGWFLPYGKTQKSNALLVEIDTSVNPIAVYLTGGNSFSLNAVYNGVVLTTNSDISAGMVLPQTWNYFCYTVECSGNTVGTAKAIQSLYLNGSSIPVVNMTASYVSTPFMVTYMGKGIVYTNQFQGKLAEMRSFQRVLNPVENRVLSVCNNVGSAGALTIMPSVVISDISSTGIYEVPYTMTNSIAFSSASMFSYLIISRSPAFLYTPSTVTVLLSELQRVNGNFIWNDVSVNASAAYTYTITPFVGGNGASTMTTLVTSGLSHGPPTPLVLSSSYNSPNVTLSWTGGLGDNVVLTYTLTSGTANTTSGNLTYNIAGGSATLSVTGSGPWTYNMTATNSKGTTTASTTASIPGIIYKTFTKCAGSSSITWGYTSAVNSCYHSFICCNSTGQYVYIINEWNGTNPKPYYSSDYGATFAASTCGTMTQWWGGITCNSTGQYVWITSNGFIGYSNNYGVTYTSISSLVNNAITSVVSSDGTKVFIGGNSGNPTIAYSSNGTATTPTFTTLSVPWVSIQYSYVYNMVGSANLEYIYVNLTNNTNTTGLYVTTNLGSTWTPIATPWYGGGTIGFSCDTTGKYLANVPVNGNTLYYSINYGVSWVTVTLPQSGCFFSQINASGTNVNILVSSTSTGAGGLYGGYSTNSGAAFTWQNLTTGSAAGYGSIAYSTNGKFVYAIGGNSTMGILIGS